MTNTEYLRATRKWGKLATAFGFHPSTQRLRAGGSGFGPIVVRNATRAKVHNRLWDRFYQRPVTGGLTTGGVGRARSGKG